jgi:hypothetical protein
VKLTSPWFCKKGNWPDELDKQKRAANSHEGGIVRYRDKAGVASRNQRLTWPKFGIKATLS